MSSGWSVRYQNVPTAARRKRYGCVIACTTPIIQYSCVLLRRVHFTTYYRALTTVPPEIPFYLPFFFLTRAFSFRTFAL